MTLFGLNLIKCSFGWFSIFISIPMTLYGKYTSMINCNQLVIRLLSVNLIVSNSVTEGSPSEGQFINADKDYYNVMSNGSALYNGTILQIIGDVNLGNVVISFPKLSKLHHFGNTFIMIRDNYIVYAQKEGLNLILSCPNELTPFFDANIRYLFNHNFGNDSTLHYFSNVFNFIQLITYKVSKCSSPTSSPLNYLNERNDEIYLRHYPVTFIGSFKFKNFTYTFNFRKVKGFEIIIGRVCNLLDFQTFDLSYTALSAYCSIRISNQSNATVHVSFSKLNSIVYITYYAYSRVHVCVLNLTEIDIKLNKVRTDCSHGHSTVYTGVATSQIPNECVPSSSVFLCGSTFSDINGAMYSNAIDVIGKVVTRTKLNMTIVQEVHFFERKLPNLPALLVASKVENFHQFLIVDLYYHEASSRSFSGRRFKINGTFEGLDPVSEKAYYKVGNGTILSIPLFQCENYELTTCLIYFAECKVCSEGCVPITAPCNPVNTFENSILPANQSYAFSRGSLVSFVLVNKLIYKIVAYQITFSSSELTLNCINPKTIRNLIECQTDSSDTIPFNTSFNVNATLTFQNASIPLTLTGNNTLTIFDPQLKEIVPNYAFPSHTFDFQIRFDQFAGSLSNQIKIFLGTFPCENSYDNNIDGYNVKCTHLGSQTSTPSLIGRVRNTTLMIFNFTLLPRPDSIKPLIQSLFPTIKLLFPIIGDNIQSLFDPKMAFRLDSDISKFAECTFNNSIMLLCDLPPLHKFDLNLPTIFEVVLKSHGNIIEISPPVTVGMKKPPEVLEAEFDPDQSILVLEMEYYFTYFIDLTKIRIINRESRQEFVCSDIVFASKQLMCTAPDVNFTGSALNVILTVANYERKIANVPLSESFFKINSTFVLVLAIIIIVTACSNVIYRRDFMKKYKEEKEKNALKKYYGKRKLYSS